MLLDLPDHCLLLILKNNCDVATLATMANVCKKFKELILVHIFRKMSTFRLAAVDTNEIGLHMVTVSRLVRLMTPANFRVKIERNLKISANLPLITVGMKAPVTELSVESHFLGWMRCFGNISNRFQAVHFHCTIYDAFDNEGLNMDGFNEWHSIKKFIISGYDENVTHSLQLPAYLARLECMVFQHMSIDVGLIFDTLRTAPKVKTICLNSCKFNRLIICDEIIEIAEAVQGMVRGFPLGLIFINTKRVDSYELFEVTFHYGAIRKCNLTRRRFFSFLSISLQALEHQVVRDNMYLQMERTSASHSR